MQRTLTRVLLVVFGLVDLPAGLWPLLSPRGFYEDFPGFRIGWVAMDGPFNEHLIRDFGALNLALSAILIGAAVIGRTAVARTYTGDTVMPIAPGPRWAPRIMLASTRVLSTICGSRARSRPPISRSRSSGPNRVMATSTS